MAKKRYYGNEGLSLAQNLGVTFLGIPNLWFRGLKKPFFQIQFLKVLWKNVWAVSMCNRFRGLNLFFFGKKKGITG